MRPEHFAYLDRLRESGVTNMWGASPFLAREFRIHGEEANEILFAWMDSFDPDKTPEERVEGCAK